MLGGKKMIDEILLDSEDRMQKTIEVLRKEFASLRAGRANPAILDKVQVDYYGVPTPINQMANVTAPEARLLLIQPWDKSIIPNIEKAILKSDLGLNPASDGTVIRIAIPQLTQERRKELVKVIKKKAEDAKVGIRNIRRDANDALKSLEKNKEISEDENKKAQDDVQKITDKYIAEVDKILNNKEQEIMEI
ncbi:MAG: ribosome recycling factor [Clostridia bacterium]|jgi:ribosome recycling factor|nr:ribosome recycling factor [Clostridia bacterium]